MLRIVNQLAARDTFRSLMPFGWFDIMTISGLQTFFTQSGSMSLSCYQENDENILNITSIYFVNIVLVCTGHKMTVR